jgi:RNA polymerase sigma factor (sigma-70 family)
VVNRTVDGGVQQDMHTESDLAAATPDPAVSHQQVPGAGPEIQGRPPDAATHQVVVGDIPVEPSGYLPRAALLAELDRADARVSVIRAATGLRGLGATQLAAAYARAKLEAGWRLVAWVNGADTGSLLAGLAAVADATGLADEDSGLDRTDPAGTVRHWLETDGDRCLLVFDDVSDPEVLRALVPAHGAARVLITTTRKSAANLGSAVPIDVFSAAEASAFLTRRTGLDDEVGAAAVATALGHLPLALALAAPLIKGQRHGYARYLDRLQTMPTEVSPAGDDRQRHLRGVARAVLLSLATIRAADKTGMGARVMAIIAVLSSAGVSRELLHIAGRAGVLAGGGRRVAADLVDQVLESLRGWSLLTFSLDGQTIVMHRLVAQVVRNELVRRRRLGAVCWVAASVLEACAIAVAGSQDRPAVRRIPQQVEALLDNTAELAEEADEELAEILLRLRFISLYHLIELGDSALQAIAAGEPLTADLEQMLGHGHPDTLKARNSLAAAYLAAGRVADAIPLFEQILPAFQRQLGPDHPDTLTAQNNLASAYQDAGRVAEAIRLYELNLADRERLLGPDHPGTLNSLGNLAAAYLAAGRAADAIPLLEQTLAGRQRVLGPDHPDTQTARKNLAKAYQDTGRAADAIPLLEQTPAGRPRVLGPDTQTARKKLATGYRDEGGPARTIPPAEQTSAARESRAAADAAAKVLPAAFRRPPADVAGSALPVGFRRPPADPAGRPLSDRVAGPHARLPGSSSPSRTREAAVTDADHDRVVVAAIAAGDPAGIAMAYDGHAAALYGYCHWMLHDPADAAESLQDTFVLAATMLSELPEPAKLRPWLFALARSECRRRGWPRPVAREEAEAANQRSDRGPQAAATVRPADAADRPAAATVRPADAADRPADAADRPAGAAGQSAGAAVQFGAIRESSDATVQFRAIRESSDATVQFRAIRESPDSTVQFHAVRGSAEKSPDSTVQFHAVRGSAEKSPDSTVRFRAVRESSDATVQFRAVRPLADATVQFPVVSKPADATDGLADVSGYLGQAELRELIRSILADMKPREREVIELSFRHDLFDDDLAIALGTSVSRANALAARTRTRLEKSLGALRTALAGRQACTVVGELLADWDGQLTEQTRDLVAWHIEQCQTCINQARGALRPTVLSALLPEAPLPAELREKTLSRCSSTSEDAVAYRRRVVRRAESTWAALFSQAIRRASWGNIRANPGAAIATTAVAVWIAAAVSVTLLTFAGAPAAHARPAPSASSRATPSQAPQPSAGTSSRSPATASPTATASAAARPTPAFTRPAYVQPTIRPTPSPSRSPSRSPSPSPSRSPSPSPSSSPSHSPSPSPSPPRSPSRSPSPTP